jgi:AcrR family transcriptional regulator
MTRKPGRPKGKREGALRAGIIVAAMEEFARSGYDGARLESIARAAGCNRAMIYHYFGGKKRLFEAALDDVAERRMAQMTGQPKDLAEGLIYWVRQIYSEPVWTRLVIQEALSSAPAPAGPSPTGREIYLTMQLDVVRDFQARGLLRADLDARHLLALFVALTTFPASFPIVAAISLGAKDEQDMLAKWCAAIEDLAMLLQPGVVRLKMPAPLPAPPEMGAATIHARATSGRLPQATSASSNRRKS